MAIADVRALRSPAEPSPRSRMQEAKVIARLHVAELEAMLAQVAVVASEVAGGGVAYPVGVRDACGRLETELRERAQTIAALLHRASR